jgi:hypothetical protein
MGAMKNILIDVMSAMDQTAVNLQKAAALQDPELMEAVLVNTLQSLPSYLEALRSTK